MKTTIRTAQNVLIEYPLASIGDRILAYFIDALILFGYAMLIVFVNSEISQLPDFVNYFLGFVYLIYDLVCEIFLEGQTIGKRQARIKVVRIDGAQPTWSSYFLRWLVGLLEARLVPFYGVIAMLTIVIGGKGQRLGDLAGGTCVVKLQQAKTIRFEEIKEEENYEPVYSQVVQLQDKDLRIVKEVIQNYDRNFNFEIVREVAKKIKTLLEIESDMPDYTFLKTLVKDYEHLTARM